MCGRAKPIACTTSRAAPLKFFISNGPGSEDLVWLDEMPTAFEAQYPQRDATIDPAQRHKMAERYYQMLVNREHGSTVVTQFIGNIPLSKAEPHRHLYEEALIFLNGAGVVWTEKTKTAVAAGDVLFLPRKQAALGAVHDAGRLRHRRRHLSGRQSVDQLLTQRHAAARRLAMGRCHARGAELAAQVRRRSQKSRYHSKALRKSGYSRAQIKNGGVDEVSD